MEEEEAQTIDLDSNDEMIRRSSKNYCSSRKVDWLKMMVKLIAFSLVLAFFYSLFSLFPRSTSLFSLLNHANERKYMFLISNAILFLLSTTSSLINIQHPSSSSSSSSSSYNSFDQTCSFPHFEHDHLVAAIDDESDSDQEEEEEICRGELEEDDEGCFTDEIEEEEEEEEEEKRELEIVVSTEELNNKIEEFIRKMKEEMRIEAAQTQLIAV